MVRLTESPRDALQGLSRFIPTDLKIQYLKALLEVGYDVVETGSFVSERAIPQMKDTSEVLKNLNGFPTRSKIQVLAGNQKYAEMTADFDIISIISYPFSCSDTFLKKNLNTTFEKSMVTLSDIRKLATSVSKQFAVYMAMAFGNPYMESWSVPVLTERIKLLQDLGIQTVILSDTIGFSTPENIRAVFEIIPQLFPEIQFGFHLHSQPGKWFSRIDAAYSAGCRWFEGVTGEAGGCPMTGYDMVGNISSLHLIEYLTSKGIDVQLDQDALRKSTDIAAKIFS